MKFNPIDEHVRAEQLCKKAINPWCKERAKCLTSNVLKDIPSTIPKGYQKNQFRTEGCLKELYLVKKNIVRERGQQLYDRQFSGNKTWVSPMLQRQQSSCCSKQKLTRNEAITLAGCGSLHFHELITDNKVQ